MGSIFTVDSELNLPGVKAGSIGGCADELSSLTSRGGGDAEAAVSVEQEGWTTQIQLLSTLQNKSHRGKARGQSSFH